MHESLLYFHLPFLIIALITGYEIGGYFLYLYFFKSKKELQLNKILFAYGILYMFLITTILIRTIYTYLLTDEAKKLVVFRFSHLLIFVGAALFLLILSSKPFDKIMSNKITRLVMIIAIINSILLMTIDNDLFQIFIIFFSISIAGIYLLRFHYNLIKIATGNIKKRILLITLGNILIVVGIIFQADEIISIFSYEDQINLMLASNPLFLFGALIVFLGMFKFPAFMEFDWKEYLASFYVINNDNLYLLYNYDFTKSSKYRDEHLETDIKKVLSKGVLGISQIFSNVAHTSDKIQVIKQGESNILVSKGDHPYDNITFILLAYSNMNSYLYLINKLKNDFQETYGSILINLNLLPVEDYGIFLNFDKEIQTILR